MKLTKTQISTFKHNQASYGTEDALTYFGDAIAQSFLTNVTKSQAKQFDVEVKEHGLETALYNVVWSIASKLLADLGVTSIKTSSKKGKK